MNFKLTKWIWGIRIALSIIISLAQQVHLNAESATNDSLVKLVNIAEDDTNKVNLLIQLSKSYYYTDYNQALVHCKSYLKLSDELDFDKGKLIAYSELGIIYKNIGEPDSALYYIKKSIEVGEMLGSKKQLIRNYNVYGSLLRRKGYYSSALDCHYKSLALSQQVDDKYEIANTYIFIAIIYSNKLNYDTAIIYYYKSMRMYEELENNQKIGIALLNIGDIYKNLHDYSKAKEKYKNGLLLFEEQGDLRNIGLSFNKIGIVYSKFGKYDSALYYYRICQTFYDSIKNISGIAHCNIDISNIFYYWGMYDSAYIYLSKAKNTFKQMGFKRGYLKTLINLANLYSKKGQLNTSLKIYDTCQEIASQVSPYSLLNVYSNVLNIYKDLGNYKKAFEYQTKYLEINDSVFQLEKAKTITDLELKYEKKKDQARILELENENLVKSLDLRKRTNQRNIYLFTGLASIVIVLFLLIFYRFKARKDKIIAEQKIRQLEEEKKLLAAKSIVEGQDEERKRIAKDLHDGLGVLLSATKISFSAIKDKSPENRPLIDKATKLLDQAAGDVRRISHNMMPGLLTRFGLYEAVEDLLEQLGETEELNTICNITGDTKRMPENTEIMLYRIIQEMVNNTLKHAEAKNISFNMNILPEFVKINYSDDGKGFDVEEKMESKSIGLSGIRSRVNFLTGEINIESSPAKGVNYYIKIPTI